MLALFILTRFAARTCQVVSPSPAVMYGVDVDVLRRPEAVRVNGTCSHDVMMLSLLVMEDLSGWTLVVNYRCP